jgi:hypothetical protein
MAGELAPRHQMSFRLFSEVKLVLFLHLTVFHALLSLAFSKSYSGDSMTLVKLRVRG